MTKRASKPYGRHYWRVVAPDYQKASRVKRIKAEDLPADSKLLREPSKKTRRRARPQGHSSATTTTPRYRKGET